MQNSMPVCPHCGGQISANARFCKMCGQAVAAEPISVPRQDAPPVERKCAACGMALSETAQFCEACGQPIELAIPQPTSVALKIPPVSAPAPPGAHPPAVPPQKGRFSPLVLVGLAAGACICVALVSLLGGLGAFWWNKAGPTEFTLGPTQMYAVAAAQDTRITDSVTGHTVRFPDGGSGNVQIAKITSGPAAPLEGESVHIEYQGTTPIQLMLKDPGAGAKIVVMGYGYIPGAYVANQWIALPQGKVVDGLVTVDLVMPFEPSLSMSQNLIASLAPGFGLNWGDLALPPLGKVKAGFYDYHISKLTAKSDDAEQSRLIGKQIAENVQRMLDTLLPTGIYYRATADRDRLSPFEVDPYVFGKGNNYIFNDKTKPGTPYYTGFGGVYGNRFPQPIIHINPKELTLAQSLAHETGHYITHILVGDDTYKTLEAQTPLIFGTDHFIGKRLSSRQSFYLEEPAYFAEYFLTGLVGGLHPDDIRQTTIVGGNTIPSTYDFPSVEGFGFLMLQSLQRQETTIKEPNRKYAADVPVVGASYGEIFEIISQGATGTDELLKHIRAFLEKKGNADKLPVIAERNGWRYQVKGRLLDAYGDPASGFTLGSIGRVGCQDYKAGITDIPTSADGKFSVDEVFPGDSLLRVTGPVNADGSQAKWDIPIKIDWEKPTNQMVDLGDLKLGRLKMFFNDTPVDSNEVVKGSPGKATFKATASGLPPTIKSLRWQFELDAGSHGESSYPVFSKDSKVQATETQVVEGIIPPDVSTWHPADEIDYAVRVYLYDMTCDKQALDMGFISVNVTDEIAPAEKEAPAEAQPQATPATPPTEVETPAEAQPQATPTTTSPGAPPAAGQGGGCWALVEPTPNLRRVEDDQQNTYTITSAEGWLRDVKDWARGGCRGQTSALVTWTPPPDRLTPGQVVTIDVTAAITGTVVCDPNYDLITPHDMAYSKFRLGSTGEEVAKAAVEYSGGPLASQATYQWTIPASGPEKIYADFDVSSPGATYWGFYRYDYTWQETGDCTPGETAVTTPVTPAAPTPSATVKPEATATAKPSAAVEQFFKVWSTGVAYNGATAPTTFTIDAAWQVTEIVTYHWNEGQGASPGTIGLNTADGTVYGPWPAEGMEGSGVTNAAWVLHPNIIIPPGDYTVLDSDPTTWSQNEETGGAGMAWGLGIRQGNP